MKKKMSLALYCVTLGCVYDGERDDCAETIKVIAYDVLQAIKKVKVPSNMYVSEVELIGRED